MSLRRARPSVDLPLPVRPEERNRRQRTFSFGRRTSRPRTDNSNPLAGLDRDVDRVEDDGRVRAVTSAQILNPDVSRGRPVGRRYALGRVLLLRLDDEVVLDTLDRVASDLPHVDDADGPEDEGRELDRDGEGETYVAGVQVGAVDKVSRETAREAGRECVEADVAPTIEILLRLRFFVSHRRGF